MKLCEKQLKSPDSADFPWLFSKYNIEYDSEFDDCIKLINEEV